MRVIFKGSKEDKNLNNILTVNNEYEAIDSIYSDYYEIKDLGYHLKKNLFKIA